jgi:transposase-like protein
MVLLLKRCKRRSRHERRKDKPFRYIRDYFSQNQDTFTQMVLDDLSHDGWEWGISIRSIACLRATHRQAGVLDLNYITAWRMSHKIRKALGERDEEYVLSAIVEADESYFGGKDRGGKRGRGAGKKSAALVMVEKGRSGEPRYAKMKVIEDVKGETIQEVIWRGIERETAIITDGFKSYDTLAGEYEHCKEVLKNPEEAAEKLPWVHILVSNAKGIVKGIYHGVSKKHLQKYLDEICYRFSRRFFKGELFNRALRACVMAGIIAYSEVL